MNYNEKVKKCENIGRKLTEEMFGDKYNFTYTKEQHNRVDFTAVSKGGTKRLVGEIKAYRNPEYPRNHDKFGDYQIDVNKLFEILQRAEMNDAEPVLIVHFTDRTMVWNLKMCDWKNRCEWRNCNDKGVDYGKSRSWSYQTHLLFSEAVYGGDDYKKLS